MRCGHASPACAIVANPDRGISAGLNRAVRAASHDGVILRCDARCVLPPDYVRHGRGGARVAPARPRSADSSARWEPVAFTRAVAMAMTMAHRRGRCARYRLGGAVPVPPTPSSSAPGGARGAGGGGRVRRDPRAQRGLRVQLAAPRARRARSGSIPALAVGYRPRGSISRRSPRQYFAWGWWKRVMLRPPPAFAALAPGGRPGARARPRGLGRPRGGGPRPCRRGPARRLRVPARRRRGRGGSAPARRRRPAPAPGARHHASRLGTRVLVRVGRAARLSRLFGAGRAAGPRRAGGHAGPHALIAPAAD